MNNGGCNQTCVDTTVGRKCSCFSGFQLASDMKNCSPKGNLSPHSYVSTTCLYSLFEFISKFVVKDTIGHS